MDRPHHPKLEASTRKHFAQGPQAACFQYAMLYVCPVLDSSDYVHACCTMIKALRQLDAPFTVRLHTEMPPRRYTLHPGLEGLYFNLPRPSTIDPADYALEDFEAIPNLEIVLNAEPQAVLDDFGTCDILILSLSSFGYVGGLLNPRGLVIYAPWWHPPLPHWLVADQDGHLDAAPVESRVREYVAHRDGAEAVL